MGEINIFGVSYCDLLSCLPFPGPTTACIYLVEFSFCVQWAVGSILYTIWSWSWWDSGGGYILSAQRYISAPMCCCYTPNTGRNSIVTGIWLYPANLPFGVPMMLLKCSNLMPLYTLDLSPHSLILPALPMSLCVCVVPLTFSNTISHSIWSLLLHPVHSAGRKIGNW